MKKINKKEIKLNKNKKKSMKKIAKIERKSNKNNKNSSTKRRETNDSSGITDESSTFENSYSLAAVETFENSDSLTAVEAFQNCDKHFEGESSMNTLETAEHEENTVQETMQKKKIIKAKAEHRTEPSQNISEFNLTEIGKERVKLDDLIKTSQKTGQLSVKKQLQNVKKLKSLSIPLSKPQLEKIKRTVSYDKVCNEVKKWDTIVKSNRDAEQITYPLKRPEFHLESLERTAERYVSKHPVEEAVSKLLQTSENVLDKTRTLTAAEEKALEAMSPEEAKNRHNELMKHRALLSYKESKARRQNKIKSKRYHRILKREKLKQMMKEFEELQKTDEKAALEKFLEADKLRVLERMTLKHRNTGKWAKQQKIRAKYNPESRSNLKEDLLIGKQLKEKVAAQKSMELKSREEEIDPEDTFFEESTDDFLIEDVPFVSEPAGTTLSNVANYVKSQTQVKASESQRNEDNNVKPKENGIAKPFKEATVGEEMAFSSQLTTCLDSMMPNNVTFGDEDLDDRDEDKMTLNQVFAFREEDKVTISEAFADEYFISEFQEEKKAADIANRPQGVDLFLPGWGNWVGPGVKQSKKKRRRFFIKPLDNQPKKNTLGNVIINEDKDKKASKHQVSHLPFPFTNVHQFQSIIRQPVGPTWNPQSSFQNLTAPKVITKMGKIIDPIDSEDVVLEKEDPSLPLKKKKRRIQELKAF